MRKSKNKQIKRPETKAETKRNETFVWNGQSFNAIALNDLLLLLLLLLHFVVIAVVVVAAIAGCCARVPRCKC